MVEPCGEVAGLAKLVERVESLYESLLDNVLYFRETAELLIYQGCDFVPVSVNQLAESVRIAIESQGYKFFISFVQIIRPGTACFRCLFFWAATAFELDIRLICSL